MEVACGVMWLVDHVHPGPQVTFFSHREAVSDSATGPELGVPRGKKSVATPQSPPPEDTKARSSCSEEPLIGSPLWIAKKLLGIRLLFISPFSYFSKSLSIPFTCALLLRFSCGNSSLGSPCLFLLKNLGH